MQVGRIIRSADFERALGAPARARSAHFAVHHLTSRRGIADLSTTRLDAEVPAVDECASERLWVGCVVPKRHARRSVTRSLIKRQIRAAVLRHAEQLAAGWWVVRLRAPFDPARWPSAASQPLLDAARDELDTVLRQSRADATPR